MAGETRTYEETTAADLAALAEHVRERLGEAVIDATVTHGQLQIVADAARILDVLRFLRDDPACRFTCFTDLCGVDYPQREKRFEVVTHLLSPTLNLRVRVKAA
ncbi:MAG TPA: NADH-quinone oxidoreductase subunit C, partial [Thermopetrobacter sp.]|nr:NADH-quinone oxidoreductase subunit C [Thermopetrobacter sp.]